jgi:cell division protein ZapA (FtsZ GTPase activity inhibitor)
MTQRMQHITLRLYAHHLSINVPADEEHLYRKAAELLNEKYLFYKDKMKNKSAELLWVYVALDIAVTNCEQDYSTRLEPIDQKIKELNNTILQQLNKDQL